MTDTPAVAHAHDELIIDSVPGLVAILNPAGEVEAVNDQILEYCGEPLQAMKHWGTNGIVHAEDVPRIAPAFAHAITTGVPYDFDARIRRFDGIYRWFQVRGRPLGDLDGSIARWYVLLTDIDDLKRTQEELRRMRRFSAECSSSVQREAFIGGPPRARCFGRSRSIASSRSIRPRPSPPSCARAESIRTICRPTKKRCSEQSATPVTSSTRCGC